MPKREKPKNYTNDEKRRRVVIGKYGDKKITEEERFKSRLTYLEKRKHVIVSDKEKELEEEKNFAGEKLSGRENLKRDTTKHFLDIFHNQEKRKRENKHFYQLPADDEKIEYNIAEPKKKDKSKNEWETRQLQSGLNERKRNKHEEQYEILVDDFLDFEENGVEVQPEKNLIEEVDNVDESAQEKRESDMTIEEVQKSLPIYKFKSELLKVIKENQVVIIEGETGSGKTTQLPQYLLEAGYCNNGKKICITQPRRVAAMSVAARVAQELRVKLGDRVGYNVRFDSRVSDETQLKYMTDGMLLREFLTDPEMKDYSVIIIDEAHERTLQTDVVFGLLKTILDDKPELKVIVSSATCDTEKFAEFFENEAPIFKIPGRRYPVDIFYTKEQEPDYVEASVVTVLQIHITQPLDGDILVFLTGQQEIEDARESLQNRISSIGKKIRELIVLPIYSSLPSEKQAKIFLQTPPEARKVVLATNIAETSLTIDNIKYVIDCGYCKQKSFNVTSKMDVLKVVPVSQASAIQRAGRAGRVGPGKCFRLYRKCTFDDELDKQPVAEMMRANLSSVVLLLLSLNVKIPEIYVFPFIDTPSKNSLDQAIRELYYLGALSSDGGLSSRGDKMVELPCEPMISAMLVRAHQFGAGEQILTIAAMLSSEGGSNVFYKPRADKAKYSQLAHRALLHDDGDLMTLLNIYEQYATSEFSNEWCKNNYIQSRTMKTARNVRDQLLAICEKFEIPIDSTTEDTVAIRKAITAGFFINTAKFNGDCYRRLKKNDSVYIHSSCVFKMIEDGPPPRYVVFTSILETEQEYMRNVISIDPQWLVEVAPHVYKESDFVNDKKFKFRR